MSEDKFEVLFDDLIGKETPFSHLLGLIQDEAEYQRGGAVFPKVKFLLDGEPVTDLLLRHGTVWVSTEDVDVSLPINTTRITVDWELEEDPASYHITDEEGNIIYEDLWV